MSLEVAIDRLSGRDQARRARSAILSGREHQSDGITGYEAIQASVLVAHGSFAFHGAPTSGAFVDVIAELPGPTAALWFAFLLLGVGQVVAIAAIRLLRLPTFWLPRAAVLLLSIFAFILLAGARASAGGYVAAWTTLAGGMLAFGALDAVLGRAR